MCIVLADIKESLGQSFEKLETLIGGNLCMT